MRLYAARVLATFGLAIPFAAFATCGHLCSADDAIIDAQIAVKEAAEPRTKEISIGCNNSPLPTTPIGPTWQITVDESFIGRTSKYQITAWRKQCTEDDQQLMVTLRPTDGPTTLLSPFAVQQGERTFNVMPVVNEANTAFAGLLTATTTVLLQYIGSRSEAFDDDQAMAIKVLSLGGPTLTLNIPAAEDAEPPGFVIDGKVRGAFFDPSTSGQGMYLDVVQGEPPHLAIGWFTASPDPSKDGEHEWYTLIGPVAGDRASLEIFLTTGQRFMEPTAVTTTKVGTATVRFTSCAEATFEYSIPEFSKFGSAPLQRLTPVPEGCD